MITLELKKQYQEARGELEKISPWPWLPHRESVWNEQKHYIIAHTSENANCLFISSSPSRIAALCDEIEGLVANIMERDFHFHRCELEPDWGHNPAHTHCADKRHGWTPAQWLIEARRILSGEG